MKGPRFTVRTRIILWGPVACVALALAACSSGSGSSTSSTPHVNGPTGLGATTANWAAVHPSGSSGDSFGPSVDTGAGTKDRYTSVTHANGRVTGWNMAFSSGTRLAPAEAQVRRELPADATQTASWRGAVHPGSGACEVVNFKSRTIDRLLGSVPGFAAGTFAVSFSQRSQSGATAASIVRVNHAVVGMPARRPGSACPS